MVFKAFRDHKEVLVLLEMPEVRVFRGALVHRDPKEQMVYRDPEV